MLLMMITLLLSQSSLFYNVHQTGISIVTIIQLISVDVIIVIAITSRLTPRLLFIIVVVKESRSFVIIIVIVIGRKY